MYFKSFASICCLALITGWAAADTVVLNPSQDNAIYADNTSNSNGSGDFLFAGQNGAGSPRRSLLQFDLSAIPTGSTINSVTATLELSQTGTPNASDISFHRLLNAWGESTSDANGGEGGGIAAATGDATWDHTFFSNQFWNTPGGDFVATASATTNVGPVGNYDWNSAGLVSDLQGFLDGDFDNFGWILIGDESVAGSSSNRFNSRTNSDSPPTLTIDFTTVPEPGTCIFFFAGSFIALRRHRK